VAFEVDLARIEDAILAHWNRVVTRVEPTERWSGVARTARISHPSVHEALDRSVDRFHRSTDFDWHVRSTGWRDADACCQTSSLRRVPELHPELVDPSGLAP
jgi:hypothetical protein